MTPPTFRASSATPPTPVKVGITLRGLLLAAAALAAGRLDADTDTIDSAPPDRLIARKADDLSSAEEEAFRAAAARVAASVVRVETAGVTTASLGGPAEANPGSGPSSGVVVDPDGWIIATSFAVPQDAREAIVVIPAAAGAAASESTNRLLARVVGRDLSRGIVLLKADGVGRLPAAETAAKRDLAVGQWTIAVGRTLESAEPSIAVGILSATSRAWGRAVQTDASVSPANYGGPLVDISGRVIGILAPLPADTAGMNLGTELYDSGIGFAVPMEDITGVLARLKEGATLAPGILGISYRSRDPFTGEAVIATVRSGSPAARAGLRAGDTVVEADGQPVTRIAQLRHVLVPRYAGDTVEIVVERRAGVAKPQRIEARVTLAESLPPWRRPVIGVVPSRTAARDAAPMPVVVDWVWPDGPAARAGIVAGDVLESVAVLSGPGAGPDSPATDGPPENDAGQEPVTIDSPTLLGGIVAGAEVGAALRIALLRDGKRSTVELTTVSAPGEMPTGVVPWSDRHAAGLVADGGEAVGNVADAAGVSKLESPEEARPPLVVLPAAAGQPLAVLVYCGAPHGPVEQEEATAWKAAAARHGVAVILPGSGDPQRWSRTDVATVARSLDALRSRRAVDPSRVAVAGTGPGAAFAWLVADALGPIVRGVALLDSGLPRQSTIDPAEPGRSRWVLFGRTDQRPADRSFQRIEADRKRLRQGGFPVGTIQMGDGGTLPADAICAWTDAVGLL